MLNKIFYSNLFSILLHFFICIVIIYSSNFNNKLIIDKSLKTKQIITVDVIKIAKKTNIKIATDTKELTNKNFIKEVDFSDSVSESSEIKKNNTSINKELNNKTTKQLLDTIKVNNKKNLKMPSLDKYKYTAIPKLPNTKLQRKNDELTALLKDIVNNDNKINNQKDDIKSNGLKGYAKNTNFNKKNELTIKIEDLLQSKFLSCWNIPISVKGLKDMYIKIKISLLNDGSVVHAKVLDALRYKDDNFFQVVTDSALRAINECSPIKELVHYDYDLWSEFTLTFDPGLFL